MTSSFNLMIEESRLLKAIARNWAFCFLLSFIILFSFTGKGFFSIMNFQNIIHLSVIAILMASAETFVIISGGIDLSVGYVMELATIVSAKLIAAFSQAGMSSLLSIILGIIITMVIGLIPGMINGLLVSRLKVPPFIATFSMLGICHGVSELLISEKAAKNLPHLANAIGNGHFVYIVKGGGISFFSRPEVVRGVKVYEFLPNVVFIAFIFIAVFAFILSRTKFGQHTYAIGGNKDAAIRSGIDVNWHIVKIYMLSSFLASLAGILYVLKYVTGKADAGASSLLDSIAAVVIGGASLYGGKGTV